jgi:hypothetical protein
MRPCIIVNDPDCWWVNVNTCVMTLILNGICLRSTSSVVRNTSWPRRDTRSKRLACNGLWSPVTKERNIVWASSYTRCNFDYLASHFSDLYARIRVSIDVLDNWMEEDLYLPAQMNRANELRRYRCVPWPFSIEKSRPRTDFGFVNYAGIQCSITTRVINYSKVTALRCVSLVEQTINLATRLRQT